MHLHYCVKRFFCSPPAVKPPVRPTYPLSTTTKSPVHNHKVTIANSFSKYGQDVVQCYKVWYNIYAIYMQE